MDSLEQLPLPNVDVTPNEESIVNRYFEGGDNKKAVPVEGKWSKFMKSLKLAAIILVAFIIVANPWLDGIFCKIPYCSSPGAGFGMKSLIFFLATVAMLWLLG